VLLGFVVWAVWRIPQLLYAYVPDAKERAAVEATTRTGLIAGLAGLAALGSLAMANRTYRLSQQSQLTERYSKAIEQLGDDKLDIRLGGLYALERLAVDSKRDHPTVVEVLSAFVREHTDSAGRRSQVMAHMLNVSASKARNANVRPVLTGDVHAALTILGRLPHRDGISRSDLAFTDLAGADLQQADLSGADLGWTDLSMADLREADLSKTKLSGSNLSQAVLKNAILPGANLDGVNLDEALLQGANLAGASLLGADLTNAMVDRANMTGSRLGGAKLAEALLLTQEHLDAAIGDAGTVLPSGLERPESWTKDV
jgi:hypothetical protein